MPITQQSKIAIQFLIFISIILGLSVLLGLWRIWASLIPLIACYLIQWIGNARKGLFLPPLSGEVMYLGKWVKGKCRAKEPLQQRKFDQPAQAVDFAIKSISQWLVMDMLKCSYLGDFTSIGKGGMEKLTEQYNRLIFQYMDAKADPLTEKEKGLKVNRLIASTWYMGIEVNIELLKQMYSPAACKFLRSVIYKQYPVLPFTRETYLSDCKRIEGWLISVKIELDRIDEQLSKSELGAKNAQTEKASFEKRESEIQDLIFELNSVFKTSYSINTMFVSELASGEKRLKRHYRDIEERIKKMKH